MLQSWSLKTTKPTIRAIAAMVNCVSTAMESDARLRLHAQHGLNFLLEDVDVVLEFAGEKFAQLPDRRGPRRRPASAVRAEAGARAATARFMRGLRRLRLMLVSAQRPASARSVRRAAAALARSFASLRAISPLSRSWSKPARCRMPWRVRILTSRAGEWPRRAAFCAAMSAEIATSPASLDAFASLWADSRRKRQHIGGLVLAAKAAIQSADGRTGSHQHVDGAAQPRAPAGTRHKARESRFAQSCDFFLQNHHAAFYRPLPSLQPKRKQEGPGRSPPGQC